MNNLSFLREEAGLSMRKLADMAGISVSLISQFESGARPFTARCSEALAKVLMCTQDFIEGKSNYGIFCFDGTEQGIALSKIEYIHQKRIGNIEEALSQTEAVPESKIQELKETFPNDWENVLQEWRRPFVERTIKQQQEGLGGQEEAIKKEVVSSLQSMSKEQLEKTLLIIKEVILK